MADDVYGILGALGRELEKLDTELNELRAKYSELKNRRIAIEGKIRDAATRIVASTQSAPTVKATATATAVAESSASAELSTEQLAPRYVKLLGYLDGKRDVAALAQLIYGGQDAQSRRAISSDLSRLKSLKLVESVHRGVLKRTAAGDRAMGGQRKAS